MRPRSWPVDLVDHKLEDAKRFGATHGVKPDDLAALQAELTGGDGFDYAFEAIGIPLTMRAAFDATRRGGTTCVIGAGGFQHEVTFNGFELFYSEKTFVGSYYGSADVRSDFNRILRLWKAGRLDLEGMITRKIGLEMSTTPSPPSRPARSSARSSPSTSSRAAEPLAAPPNPTPAPIVLLWGGAAPVLTTRAPPAARGTGARRALAGFHSSSTGTISRRAA